MDALARLANIYKDLLEKELIDICDDVLKEITVPFITGPLISFEAFAHEVREFANSKNIPVDPNFINEYLNSKIKELGIQDHKVKKFYLKVYLTLYKSVFKTSDKKIKNENSKRTLDICCLDHFFRFINLRIPSIYTDFENLKNLLDDFGINLTDQLTLFIKTLEINCSCIDQPTYVVYKPNNEKIKNHKFKNISQEQIEKLVNDDELEKFLDSKDPELASAQEEMSEYLKNNCIDVTSFLDDCVEIFKVMHKKVRTEEDDETIRECMKNLHFEDLTYRMLRYLDKQDEKCEKEALNTKDSNIKKENDLLDKSNKVDDSKSKNHINQKNIKHIYYEIGKYFNLDMMQVKETLSFDNIIYLLSLMYSIDMDESVITNFLDVAMREYKKQNPLAIYYQFYNKFDHLSDNLEIKEHLDMIEYILSEVNIFICDDEKYKSTKKLIEEEILELMCIINGNYTYEKEEAKKLLNTKED